MSILVRISQWLKFFPLQLLFSHLRKNQLLLLTWLLLFGFVSQKIAVRFGIPYLFLSPEYLNEVNWISYFLLGLSVGGFYMAFHLYSYVMLGPSFPFIASIARPFHKFCINNSLIPTFFYVVLVYNIYIIQRFEELESVYRVIGFLVSLTAGIVMFIVLTMLYFIKTNKNAEKIVSNQNIAKSFFQKTTSFIQLTSTNRESPSYYMSKLLKIKHTRNVNHYNKEILDKVFRQNHFNAKFFEIGIITSFILLGVFQNYEIVVIPAAASILLVFTLFLMFVSFLYSWFRGWTMMILFFIVFVINYISTHSVLFDTTNYAYGLDYTNDVDYSLSNLKNIQFDEVQVQDDIKHHIEILENWKKKAQVLQNTDKPKLVLLNVSGGGIRAAMWTLNVLQGVDKEMEGGFMESIHMITGASGGMIGAAYYRDIVRAKEKQNLNPYNPMYLEDISKDLLNRVAFSLVTHDLVLRHKKVSLMEEVMLRIEGSFLNKGLMKIREV